MKRGIYHVEHQRVKYPTTYFFLEASLVLWQDVMTTVYICCFILMPMLQFFRLNDQDQIITAGERLSFIGSVMSSYLRIRDQDPVRLLSGLGGGGGGGGSPGPWLLIKVMMSKTYFFNCAGDVILLFGFDRGAKLWFQGDTDQSTSPEWVSSVNHDVSHPSIVCSWSGLRSQRSPAQ